MILHDRIAAKLPSWRERVERLRKEYGAFKVCDVTVDQIYGGIRGVQIQVSDISYVDPYEGIRLRGYTIPELLKLLPRLKSNEIPYVGGLYFLLMADELPTREDALEIEAEWIKRSEIPGYVFDVLHALPASTHAMTLFSTAILALQNESAFAKKYEEGIPKSDYWIYYLEDSLNLTAKLPGIAAYIYRMKYLDGQYVAPDPKLDWAANFAHMIGKTDNKEYHDLCRLFFILHSDHEGGNVSAHASHLVCSALADVYHTCSAGMDGLAGPLHGLANQECLRWLLGIRDSFAKTPTREQLTQYMSDWLDTGMVIPGYGHAVLRITDPRFTAQLEFGQRHFPDDDIFKLASLVYECLPPLLTRQGKVKNPWPNVDAINGACQYHYGVKEFDFYTVLFGISRMLGLTAHALWSRALGKPIERPKSLTTRMLEAMIAGVKIDAEE